MGKSGDRTRYMKSMRFNLAFETSEGNRNNETKKVTMVVVVNHE